MQLIISQTKSNNGSEHGLKFEKEREDVDCTAGIPKILYLCCCEQVYVRVVTITSAYPSHYY